MYHLCLAKMAGALMIFKALNGSKQFVHLSSFFAVVCQFVAASFSSFETVV